MKKILIAVDYDPTAQMVTEAGLAIARAMDAAVVLVHVLSDPQYYSQSAYSPITGFGGYMDMSFPEPALEEQLREAAFGFPDKIRSHSGDASIETIVKEGDVAGALLEAATEEGAGMIVMGSHSRKWLEAVLMGSVTEKVLRHTAIPLFIVPTKKND
jgi:nucleotide-binding universal stress UspA family protein